MAPQWMDDRACARISMAVPGALDAVGGRWNLCAYDTHGERVDLVPIGPLGAERAATGWLVDPPARGILQRAARGPTILDGLYELVITDDALAFLRLAESAQAQARTGVLGINPSIWPDAELEDILLANVERIVVRVWDPAVRRLTVDRLRCGPTKLYALSAREADAGQATSDHDLFETYDRHGIGAFELLDLTEEVVRSVAAGHPGEADVRSGRVVEGKGRPPDERKVIQQVANVSVVTDEAGLVLAERDGGIYQRGLELVRVISTGDNSTGFRPDDDAILRSAGANAIRQVTVPHLVDRLTRVAKFVRLDRRSDAWVERPPSMPVVRALLERAGWPGMRRLQGLADFPVLRPDGSILATPGYDQATGLFVSIGDIELRVQERPTQREARGALDLLHNVVVDFPFAAPAHRDGWVAALLTVLARPAIDGPTPGFLVEANIPGVGKGKLVNMISRIASGRPAPVTPHSEREEEMRKLVTSLVISGDPIILIDNVRGRIGGAALEALLTSSGEWRDRLLGTNERTAVPMLAVVFATSNNASVTRDMIRRLVHIRMETLTEEPECRTDFQHPNLEVWVMTHRARLLSAALTVLRAYAVAQRPAVGLRPLGSFESWSRVVRDAIVWAGGCDPLAATKGLRDSAAGDETAALRALMTGIEVVARREATSRDLSYPREMAGVTAATILKAAYQDGPTAEIPGLLEAVETLCPSRASRGGKVLVSVFGGMLRDHEKQTVDGRYVSRDWHRWPHEAPALGCRECLCVRHPGRNLSCGGCGDCGGVLVLSGEIVDANPSRRARQAPALPAPPAASDPLGSLKRESLAQSAGSEDQSQEEKQGDGEQ